MNKPTPTVLNDEQRRPVLNASRVAGLLGVSERSVYRLVQDGNLPAFRIGRMIRFAAKDIDDFLRAARIDRKA